jgi:hypothetical protein
MKIQWKGKGRTWEYGKLSIPVSDLEIDKQWNGYRTYPVAWVENGRLCILVKRFCKKGGNDGSKSSSGN